VPRWSPDGKHIVYQEIEHTRFDIRAVDVATRATVAVTDDMAALIDQLRTDPHAPARYRILGPLVNVPAFAQAFNCPANAPMARPAEQVISIW
jgi:hypothetical protein